MTDVPLGPTVPDAACPLPWATLHIGKSVTLEPLSLCHVADLWDAADGADPSWTYLKYGPFPARPDLAAHVARISGLDQQPFFAVIPTVSGRAEG